MRKFKKIVSVMLAACLMLGIFAGMEEYRQNLSEDNDAEY